ncbi:MAG: hypothetical protein IPL79_02730 [Myxococcales bacterium]|nr:hypothetical protein [Myxococcales bacterium]
MLQWSATPALADQRAASEQKFRAGQKAFEIGDYTVAAQAFEESYALLPLPAIRFSLAQAFRLQYYQDKVAWRAAAAAMLYRQYVDEVKTGARVPDATQWLGELEPIVSVMTPAQRQRPSEEKRTTVVVYATAADAKIKWDGALYPSPLTKVVAPGSYDVEVLADGYFSQTEKVVALEGALTTKEVLLRAMPARLTVPKTSGLVVKIDGRRTETPSGVALMAAGSHVVVLSRPGRNPRVLELNVARDELVDASQPLSVSTKRRWAKGLFWTSGAVAVGGGVLAALALYHDDRADTLHRTSETVGLTLPQAAAYEDHRTKRDRFRQWGLVSGGVAVATVGIASLLYFKDHAQPEPSSSAIAPSVVPVIESDLIGISWTGSY